MYKEKVGKKDLNGYRDADEHISKDSKQSPNEIILKKNKKGG